MVTVELNEEEVVRAMLEFLDNRGLHIAQIALERETGLINGRYSDDVLFLRQLVIDGQWDTALDFVQPLIDLDGFKYDRFRYSILKYKYYELLCIKQEPGPMCENEYAVEELVDCLKEIEDICPSKEEYKNLCLLLTLPRFSDHVEFKRWNPSSQRVQCFREILPLVEKLLPPATDSNSNSMTTSSNNSMKKHAASNERLMQLMVKGVFYESCLQFCQEKATKTPTPQQKTGVMVHGELLGLTQRSLCNADLGLVSWLESMPQESFGVPFEQRQLSVKLNLFKRPQLEAAWQDVILQTPVRPRGVFPQSATPLQRFRSVEKLMTRSLLSSVEYSRGSTPPSIVNSSAAKEKNSAARQRDAMTRSALPGFQLSERNRAGSTGNIMERSIAVVLDGPGARNSEPPQSRATPKQEEKPQRPQPQVIDIPLEGVEYYTSSDVELREPPDLPVFRQLEEIKRRSGVLAQTPPQRVMEPIGIETPESSGRLLQAFKRSSVHSPRLPAMIPENAALSDTESFYRTAQPQAINAISMQLMQASMQLQQEINRQHQSPVRSTVPLTNPPPSKLPQPSQGSLQKRVSIQEASPPHAPNGDAQGTSTMNFQQRGPRFVQLRRLEDPQAIRATAFHPSGSFYAIGTNSQKVHICSYPTAGEIASASTQTPVRNADVVHTQSQYHKGSIYCVAFNQTGNLLATGSNDKLVKVCNFNARTGQTSDPRELTFHDGTVRDCIFMENSLLISGGAGKCHIYITDCGTMGSVRCLEGHTAPILGLYSWGGNMFVSCSQDKTVRFWDLRCPTTVNLIMPSPNTTSSPVTSVCVDPSGRLLVSGHEDSSVMLYDVSSTRVVQLFRPHDDQVRTVRFSPGAYYLLSGSYDSRIALTDMRGDLMDSLRYVPVAQHADKIIQCRWHPNDFAFLSTSADRSAVLWTVPDLIK